MEGGECAKWQYMGEVVVVANRGGGGVGGGRREVAVYRRGGGEGEWELGLWKRLPV